jgi:hypothetical protein
MGRNKLLFFRTFFVLRNYAIFRNRVIWTFLLNLFLNLFSNFCQTFFQTYFRSFFELPPSHPLDCPPTICKLCPINNYNIFFDLFSTFFRTFFWTFFELFKLFQKAQFNYVIINFNKKKQLKVQFKIQFKIQYKIQFKIQ